MPRNIGQNALGNREGRKWSWIVTPASKNDVWVTAKRLNKPVSYSQYRARLTKCLQLNSRLSPHLGDDVDGRVHIFLSQGIDRATWANTTIGQTSFDKFSIHSRLDSCNLE